jgi:hypothetical protein
LLRYRFVGRPPRLETKAKTPASIAHEPDLYRLPDNSTANDRNGNDLEAELGAKVDQRIASIVARASGVSGHVLDQTLERDLVWLMKTFIARGPQTISKQEATVAESLKRNEGLLDHLLERAQTPEMRAHIRQYKDARMPKVAARAALALAIEGDILRREGWLEGDVHIVHAQDVRQTLDEIGAGEFVTFENPVVEWDASPFGLVATFSLSPTLLLLIVNRGSTIALVDYSDVVAKHNLKPLSTRRSMICRTVVSGKLAAAASTLMRA